MAIYLLQYILQLEYVNNLFQDIANLMQADPAGILGVQSNLSSMELFPNPAKGMTTLRIKANTSSACKVW